MILVLYLLLAGQANRGATPGEPGLITSGTSLGSYLTVIAPVIPDRHDYSTIFTTDGMNTVCIFEKSGLLRVSDGYVIEDCVRIAAGLRVKKGRAAYLRELAAVLP